MSDTDEEQPLSRKLFRMAVVLLLTTLLLATRGFGAFPENEISASLAQMLAQNLPTQLSQALDGYLSAVNAPSLAAVATIHSETNPSDPSSTTMADVLSDPRTELQQSNTVVLPAPVSKSQPSQTMTLSQPAIARNANDAAQSTATTEINKPSDAPTRLPNNTIVVSATPAPKVVQASLPTLAATTSVGIQGVRIKPTVTRKPRAPLPVPSPSPRVVVAPTMLATPLPTPQPPPAPSGQTQSSPATATPDLPLRVTTTQTPAHTTTSTPLPTPTVIPEIVETAMEPEPTQQPMATATEIATPTTLPTTSPSSTPAPSETPQPTATDAPSPTLAPTETPLPSTPTPQPTQAATPTRLPSPTPEITHQATSAPTQAPTPEPERTKKPHPITHTPKPATPP